MRFSHGLSTSLAFAALLAVAAPASALQYSGNPGDTTAPAAPTLAVTTFTTDTVTVTVTGSFGDDGAGGAAATTYDLRYSTSAINAGNFGTAQSFTGEPAPTASPVNQLFPALGGAGILLPNTTYWIAIKASDEVPNWSAISNVVTFTTAAVPSPSPSPNTDDDDNSSSCAAPSSINPAYVFFPLIGLSIAALWALRRK